jgi:hypothetical protein
VNEQTGLSGLQRAALIVGAIAVLVVAYVVIQGGSDDDGGKAATTSTPSASATQSTTSSTQSTQSTQSTSTAQEPAKPSVPTVRVVDAKPQGGVKKLEFKKGDQIRFRVVSDTADEIHVHGYDLMKDVAKGGSVSFAFKGSIDGRFVVELEGHGEQIAELDVAP